jgi:hypothetical protein
MAQRRIRHKEPIMGLPYPPYRETDMSGESQRPVVGFLLQS